jgi:hypothetical protein
VRKSSKGFDDNIMWALDPLIKGTVGAVAGIGAGAVSGMGHQLITGAIGGGAGLLAASRAALKSPAVRARLAAAFNDSPDVLKALGVASGVGAAIGQPQFNAPEGSVSQGRALGSWPIGPDTIMMH